MLKCTKKDNEFEGGLTNWGIMDLSTTRCEMKDLLLEDVMIL